MIGLIESISAVRNLAEILSESRLDAVLVGPADLAVSLGLPRWTNDEVIRGHVFNVLSKAQATNRSTGAPVFRFDFESIRSAGGNLFMYASNRLMADGIRIARAAIDTSTS